MVSKLYEAVCVQFHCHCIFCSDPGAYPSLEIDEKKLKKIRKFPSEIQSKNSFINFMFCAEI